MRAKAEQAGIAVMVESAGTSAYHLGEAPDARAQAEGAKRGYDLSGIRVRQIIAQDFNRFDLILGMDAENLREIDALAPRGAIAKTGLFLGDEKVADPYFSGRFSQCFDQIEQGADAILAGL